MCVDWVEKRGKACADGSEAGVLPHPPPWDEHKNLLVPARFPQRNWGDIGGGGGCYSASVMPEKGGKVPSDCGFYAGAEMNC